VNEALKPQELWALAVAGAAADIRSGRARTIRRNRPERKGELRTDIFTIGLLVDTNPKFGKVYPNKTIRA
jgi:hypothetical protein